MTIGIKRPERNPLMDNPGAGNYSPERGDGLTKPKIPNIDMGRSPSRPSTFAKPGTDEAGGPGSYDIPFQKFGDESKPMTIGVKRPQKIETGVPDAGQYSPERAEAMTKPKAPSTIDMGRAPPARPNPNPPTASEFAPDFYDTMYDFGKESKPMTIGERRPEKIESGPGPGQYNEQPVKERPRGGKID